MKLTVGLIILIFSTLLGYILSLKYGKRLNFYKDFNSFNNRLKNEISFKMPTIKEVIESETKKDDFYNCVNTKIIQNKQIQSLSYLTNEENKDIVEYINSIGTSDATTELKHLENMQNKLKDKLEICKNEKDKYQNLYIKSGFLTGLIILIIII